MANRRELRDARRKVLKALDSLQSIERLPRRKGQSVEWRNGVIWTRAGDDDWRSQHFPDEPAPSSHVASADWWPVATDTHAGEGSK